jgi:two-component system CheB/CheR fusion protein
MSELSSELDQSLDASLVPVCAIGASAGGVTALRAFFRHVQPDLNLAYVVVVHLSPDQPSVLSEILATCTSMPVQQVEDGPTLVANCVYVIPPDRELVISGNQISARPFTQPRGQRAPIDMFFRSIAAARGDGCAMILTGSGADGSQGVRAIKEAGGIVFVQEPAEAEFPMMPQNAIATGVADFIAPVAELANNLAEVAKSKESIKSLSMDGASNELRRLLGFLRARTGHDFSSYKRATVMRRVGRRMQVARCDSLASYAEYVRDTPEEAKELFSDLLISVTMFFRDARTFRVLAEQTLPLIFDEADVDSGIRAWTVGCATGEEAYSLAIMLLEEATTRKTTLPIQVFATDLDEGALATAREGRYPRTIEADVSEERLHRWFTLDGSHYRVRQEVRDVVLFATHSALKDPPFMRLDLISCRNLLIYLERPLQRQLATVFHYGLKPSRFLFLGTAETMDAAGELFTTVDREARIYQARTHRERILPQLPPFPDNRPAWAPERRRVATRDEHERGATYMHVAALERQSPPSALVDDMQRIVNLSPSAGRFIQHSGGPFTAELSSIVRPELRLDLKIALERALGPRQSTLTLPAIVAFDGLQRRIAMHVLPVIGDESAALQVLVLFLDGGPIEPDDARDASEIAAKPDETRRLYEELKIAHERLNASRHDHDVAIQDLRAANEELQSINEEYRSTAEELETSKEELQSINEELQTVNAELKSKLEHISSAHNDLQNLTSATEIGTLFLDPELRIRMFTPPVAELFNIRDSDVGRTITNFTHQMRYQGLELDARRVLRDLAPFETVIESNAGHFYMMRIRPYRTVEDRIEGLVITFVDVSARLQAERELRVSEERYRMLFDSIDEGFCVIEVLFDSLERPADYRFVDVNAAFERQTGLSNVVGKTMRAMVPGHEDYWFEIFGRVAVTGQPERFENRAAALNRFYEVYAFRAGAPGEHTVGILFKEISKRKEAETHLKLMVNELNHRVKNTLAVVQAIAQQTFKHEEAATGARSRFDGRLASLAAAHNLLTRSHWEKASLQDVVQAVLSSCSTASERVAIGGPAVNLSAAEAVSISMALHELCINAIKYGALSGEAGRVDINWCLNADAARRLQLVWSEQGGPRVAIPTHRGFGSMMVEGALAYELHGKAKLEYLPTGVVCTIEAPLSMPQVSTP